MRAAWVAAGQLRAQQGVHFLRLLGVAVLPVPIAQTGSYATTISLMQWPLTWITAASWRLTTSSVGRLRARPAFRPRTRSA